MEPLGSILKRVMKKLRGRAAFPIITIHPTDHHEFDVTNQGVVIVEDCPILKLNDDNMCKIRGCPFNNRGKCSECNPPSLYENIRGTKFNKIIRDKK